jgi:hypothetical protein
MFNLAKTAVLALQESMRRKHTTNMSVKSGRRSRFDGRSFVCYNSSGNHGAWRALGGGGVNFSEQMPSKQWAVLTFRGERIAEVWFKPEGEPMGLVFRIPQSSFQIDAVAQRLTAETLLKSVGIEPDDVESWLYGSESDSGVENSELQGPLPAPPSEASWLEVRVRLKTASEEPAPEGNHQPEFDTAKWYELEARWKTILGLEAAVEVSRKSMEDLRAQLDYESKRNLTAEDKVHALSADVTLWNKAKNRAHFTLPKVSDFIHRATWASTTPERKKLGEIFKNPLEDQTALPPLEQVDQELEVLRKDRQIMSQQGVTVCQECKSVLADVQGCVRRLQVNAAVRASKKRGGTGAKGKSL